MSGLQMIAINIWLFQLPGHINKWLLYRIKHTVEHHFWENNVAQISKKQWSTAELQSHLLTLSKSTNRMEFLTSKMVANHLLEFRGEWLKFWNKILLGQKRKALLRKIWKKIKFKSFLKVWTKSRGKRTLKTASPKVKTSLIIIKDLIIRTNVGE